eukprot:g17014.t1
MVSLALQIGLHWTWLPYTIGYGLMFLSWVYKVNPATA